MSNFHRKKIVVASGYFSILHLGHIEYLEKSKELGDILIVIVNNDKQAALKKNGKILVSCKERIQVVRALRCVDLAVESIDENRSVCRTLAMLHPDIFTNGGDQTNDNIPEAATCKTMGIEMVDDLGSKIQSTSRLIERAKSIPNYK